jgi:hypothetical protein
MPTESLWHECGPQYGPHNMPLVTLSIRAGEDWKIAASAGGTSPLTMRSGKTQCDPTAPHRLPCPMPFHRLRTSLRPRGCTWSAPARKPCDVRRAIRGNADVHCTTWEGGGTCNSSANLGGAGRRVRLTDCGAVATITCYVTSADEISGSVLIVAITAPLRLRGANVCNARPVDA